MSRDSKTQLKELTDKGVLPPVQYSTSREGGPEHETGWVATASLPDGRTATGTGRSKVEAQKNAGAALQQKYRLPKK